MRRWLFLFVLWLSAMASARAQLGLYAGYTGAKLDVANTDTIYGPTFGAYYDSHHFPVVNFGVDLRVTLLNSSSTTKVTSGVVGPRVVLHVPVVPIRPYAELLGGVADSQYGQGVALTTATNVAFGFAAGVDLRIVRFLDWRVLDYSYLRLQNTSSTYQKSLTTGLVLRLP